MNRAAAVRAVPRREHRPDDRLAPVQQPHRAGVNRDAVQEILSPVQRVENPQEIRRGFRIAFLVVFLAEYAVIGKALADSPREEILRLRIGVRHRVSLALVLESDPQTAAAAEVAGERLPRAARDLHGERFHLGEKPVIESVSHRHGTETPPSVVGMSADMDMERIPLFAAAKPSSAPEPEARRICRRTTPSPLCEAVCRSRGARFLPRTPTVRGT